MSDGAAGGRPVRPVRPVPGLGRRAIANGVGGSAVLRARRSGQRQRRGPRAPSAVVRAHGERDVDGQDGARVLQADGGLRPRRRGRADAERAGRGCRARRRPGHRVRRVAAVLGRVQPSRRRPSVRQSVVRRRPAQRRRRRRRRQQQQRRRRRRQAEIPPPTTPDRRRRGRRSGVEKVLRGPAPRRRRRRVRGPIESVLRTSVLPAHDIRGVRVHGRGRYMLLDHVVLPPRESPGSDGHQRFPAQRRVPQVGGGGA